MSAGSISGASLRYFEEKRIKELLGELMHGLLLKRPDDPLQSLQESLTRKTPLRIVITGPPGSGKGTQSQLLAQKYNLQHLCADDVLHSEGRSQSEFGNQIQSHLPEGTPVPDKLFAEVMIHKIRKAEEDNVGWVLDGFPRTRTQAIYLQTAGISPQRFFYLDVADTLAVQRCAPRSADPTATASNSSESPAQTIGGAPCEGVVTRLKYFDSRKAELIDCYGSFYVRIDGTPAPDEVFKEICEQVDALELPL